MYKRTKGVCKRGVMMIDWGSLVRKQGRKALKGVRTIKGREHPQTTTLHKSEEKLGKGRKKRGKTGGESGEKYNVQS